MVPAPVMDTLSMAEQRLSSPFDPPCDLSLPLALDLWTELATNGQSVTCGLLLSFLKCLFFPLS
jgi:hypothetical protein